MLTFRYYSLRSTTKGYGGKTHRTDSQNSDITAPIGRRLNHLQFPLQGASPETFGYALVLNNPMELIVTQLVKKFPTFYGTRRFITVFTGPF
jgi:hypothetical protein